ncbi:site-specific integrase [uncultured Stenotrophomonas sp.]|uniref:site-specific integrase n=1 Tax=uncultured Stenotrophomonas sp. TaxID=165438 RepID=UPI00258EB57E|nr:site-specific integrase [uncultured Stenotrophomonas sp.]
MNNITSASGELVSGRVPEQLVTSAAEAVRDILQEAEAPNTTRSYASALRYWAGWFVGRYGRPIALPVPPAAVVQFIVDHMGRSGDAGLRWDLPADLDRALVQAGLKKKPGRLALSSVVHRVAVLSAAHKQARQENPCEDRAVRTLLSKGRRASHKRGERASKKTALLAADLRAMVATCDASLIGKRDRALLYFAFASGGRRRSEVADAKISSLKRIEEDGFTYRLDKGKTLQAGPAAGSSTDKPILGDAAAALQDWLSTAGVTDGAIFRRVWPNKIGGALSGKAVAVIVKKRAKLAGVEGDFGGHSLRSGFVTEGAHRGIALPALMAMTGHRSVASVVGYFQAGTAALNPAARLLDE